MQIQRLVDPRVIRGNHERLAVDDETHVTDEALIQNGVDRFAVILAAVGESLNFGARRGSEGLGHASRLGWPSRTDKSQFGWARSCHYRNNRQTSSTTASGSPNEISLGIRSLRCLWSRRCWRGRVSALWWRCARRVLIRRRRCGPNARVIWFRRRVRGRGGWLL
jgi:hypothetical protein